MKVDMQLNKESKPKQNKPKLSLALNNPRRSIYHQTKKPIHRTKIEPETKNVYSINPLRLTRIKNIYLHPNSNWPL